MAMVNGGFLHYTDMKKFYENLLRNCWPDFEIISQKSSSIDLSQNCSENFDSLINMTLVNGGYLHCTDRKKFL